MDGVPFYLYFVGAAVVLASFAVAIWPGVLVRQYERMAGRATDRLAAVNQRIFDPSRRAKNISTLRLVGVLGVVFGCVLLVVVLAARM